MGGNSVKTEKAAMRAAPDSLLAGLLVLLPLVGANGNISFSLLVFGIAVLILAFIVIVEYFAPGRFSKPVQIGMVSSFAALLEFLLSLLCRIELGSEPLVGFCLLAVLGASVAFQLSEDGRQQLSAEAYLAFGLIAILIALLWPYALALLSGLSSSDFVNHLGERIMAEAIQGDYATLAMILPFFALGVGVAIYRKTLGIRED
jgi:hypothetical protein